MTQFLPTGKTVPKTLADAVLAETRRFCNQVSRLRFSPPVALVYNPLDYAWAAHSAFLRRWGDGVRPVLFLGMNPGPWGMAQTGVPFGEVAIVRDWLGVVAPVGRPAIEHPARPVRGFATTRSEVSGRRLWGLFRARFETPSVFFERHMVCNYCPLLFLDSKGRNLTPERLTSDAAADLFALCDDALRRLATVWQTEWVVGVGGFAAERAQSIFAGTPVRVARILHPSPASPAANRGWAEAATRQLEEQGIWEYTP